MAIKNTEVMRHIEEMLQDLKKQDKQQYNIILQLLHEVFQEYNTGKSKNIDKKLYDMIDAEVRFKTQNQ
jgi:hypothetical protein